MEETVDEHRGVEGHAPVAQAVVAGVAVLCARRSMPGLAGTSLIPVHQN